MSSIAIMTTIRRAATLALLPLALSLDTTRAEEPPAPADRFPSAAWPS
jgi:hypothetical protein